VFAYGDFLTAVVAFVATGAAVFFFVVKPYETNVARRPQADATTKECPECTSMIPIKARRCPRCTAELVPAG
jgi:large conductance mechanosensitive channel